MDTYVHFSDFSEMYFLIKGTSSVVVKLHSDVRERIFTRNRYVNAIILYLVIMLSYLQYIGRFFISSSQVIVLQQILIFMQFGIHVSKAMYFLITIYVLGDLI